MTLRHFQIFAAVVDNKTMHLAAENLYISQPGVSQAIRELEKHYQVTLFERFKKKLILTAEGEKLLQHVRVLLTEAERLNQDMLTVNCNPVIRVGSTVSVGEELMVPLIVGFEQRYPHVRVQVEVNNLEYVEGTILRGGLDIGVVEGEITSQDLELIPFCSDYMQLAASPTHPLVGRNSVAPQEIAGYDIVTREPGSRARTALLKLLRDHNVPCHIKWTSTDVPAIKQAVMAGQGITVLSSLVIRNELAEGKLCVINVQGLSERMNIHLALHKEKHRTQALKLFMDYCDEYRKTKLEHV